MSTKILCEAATIKGTRCQNGRTSGCTVLDTDSNTRCLCLQHFNKKDQPTFRFFDGKALFVAPITTVTIKDDGFSKRENNLASTIINKEDNVIDTSYILSITAHPDCHRCSGTGTYVWGAIVNGVPSNSGTCYRCDGTGKNWSLQSPQHDRVFRQLKALKQYMTPEEIVHVRTQIALLGGFDFARLVIADLSNRKHVVEGTQPKASRPIGTKHVAGQITVKGVKCGACSSAAKKDIYHADVAAVKACATK